jgi:hypothetical protein
MKKLFLFVAAATLTLSLNSCSKDDGGGDTLSMKIGGVKKSFKVDVIESDESVTLLGYTGSTSNPTEILTVDIEPGATGAEAVNSISYTDASDVTYFDNVTNSSVTVNNGSSVKGTFSGSMSPIGEGADILITEGTFSVKY